MPAFRLFRRKFGALSSSPIAFSWDPVAGASLPPGVTFSRASTGTYLAAATGLVTSAAVDAPRVEAAGLLIEGAATNLCQRSELFSNAKWTKTGVTAAAPTVTAAAVTSPAGVANGAERVQFSDCSAGSRSSYLEQTWSASAGRHSWSIWAKTHSGSGTAQFYLTFWTGTTYFSSLITCTGTWTRYTFAWQNLTTATWGMTIGCMNSIAAASHTALAAADVDLWGAQVEKQPVVTSYIPTPASSFVSRSADLCTVTHGLTDGSNFSLACTIAPSTSWANLSAVVAIEMGTPAAANSLQLGLNNTPTAQLSVYDATPAQRVVLDSVAYPGGSQRIIGRNSAGTLQALVSGSTAAAPSGAGTGIITTPPSTLSLGGSSSFLFGNISNIVIARTALGAS